MQFVHRECIYWRIIRGTWLYCSSPLPQLSSLPLCISVLNVFVLLSYMYAFRDRPALQATTTHKRTSYSPPSSCAGLQQVRRLQASKSAPLQPLPTVHREDGSPRTFVRPGTAAAAATSCEKLLHFFLFYHRGRSESWYNLYFHVISVDACVFATVFRLVCAGGLADGAVFSTNPPVKKTCVSLCTDISPHCFYLISRHQYDSIRQREEAG